MGSRDFGNVLQNLGLSEKQQQSSWLGGWFSGNQAEEEQKSFLGRWRDKWSDKSASGWDMMYSAANRTYRLKYFFLFLTVAVALFMGSFMFLPTVILFPQKFALLFSLGSVCFQVALSYLKPSAFEYVRTLMNSSERAFLTILYFASLFGTIWSAVVIGSYIMVCISSVLQIGILIWFLCSFIPGGTAGFKKFVRYGCQMCMWTTGAQLPIQEVTIQYKFTI